MITKRVGMREFKAQMSAYMQLVKQGNIVILTERGKPIGQITPLPASLEERHHKLLESGFAKWSGRKLKPRKPTTKLRGNKTMAELVVEGRE
jgi:antitoxin (DNA-binding transcriptional repressor) of toxin-antitoxin stability system